MNNTEICSIRNIHCTITRLVPAGNHETDNMNQMYGFEGEVKAKYTAQMFQLFSEVFQWLPLAQCINSKILVSSGRDELKAVDGFMFCSVSHAVLTTLSLSGYAWGAVQ